MKLTLTANDLPKVLEDFRQVYVLDTEYYSKPDFPDGPVVPVALQAYEVLGGKWTSLFFGQPGGTYENPLDPDALYLTFNAAAEWNCYLSLG